MSSYNFWCSKRGNFEGCPFCDKKGDFSSNEEKEYCANDESHEVKRLGSNPFVIGNDTLVNNASKRAAFQKDRQKRSRKDFEQNVMPGLSAGDQKWFKNKRGYKS